MDWGRLVSEPKPNPSLRVGHWIDRVRIIRTARGKQSPIAIKVPLYSMGHQYAIIVQLDTIEEALTRHLIARTVTRASHHDEPLTSAHGEVRSENENAI